MPILFGEDQNLPKDYKRIADFFNNETPWHEHLFASVIYIFLECGFCPSHAQCENNQTSYNAKSIVRWVSMPSGEIYKRDVKAKSYIAKLRIGNSSCPEATIIGSPSVGSQSQYLTINVYVKHTGSQVTKILKPSEFTEHTVSGWALKKKSLATLARMVREDLVQPIKSPLLFYLISGQGIAPILQLQPQLVLDKIMQFLPPRDTKNLLTALKRP